MPDLADGLGFLIRLVALLVVWLGIAAFVSAGLAALMGLALIGAWIAIILPWIGVKKVAYEAERRALALPPPSYSGGSGGGLMVRPDSRAQLPDMVRELPQFPGYEPSLPTAPKLLFIRSLIMPVAGLIMIWGAFHYTQIQSWAEMQGLAKAPRITWAGMEVPAGQPERFAEMKNAARLVMAREGSCDAITAGKLVAEGEREEYHFTCFYESGGRPGTGLSYKAWIAADESAPLPFAALFGLFGQGPSEAVANSACFGEAAAQLSARDLAMDGAATQNYFYKRGVMPYGSYARVAASLSVERSDGSRGPLPFSCWVNGQGEAEVRFGS